jgi:CHASE2 domain-containing sensor protein
VLGIAGLEGGGPQTTGRLTPARVYGGDPLPAVQRFGALLRSLDEIDGAAAGHGLLNGDRDARVVRRIPLVAAVGSVLVPTFGLEMLRVAVKVPALAARVGPGGLQAVSVGDLVIPTDPDGRVWLHYSRHDPARVVAAADVLGGRVGPDRFEGRLVLIGATAFGLSDYQATPVSDS